MDSLLPLDGQSRLVEFSRKRLRRLGALQKMLNERTNGWPPD